MRSRERGWPVADPIHQFIITPILPITVAGVDVSFTNSSL